MCSMASERRMAQMQQSVACMLCFTLVAIAGSGFIILKGVRKGARGLEGWEMLGLISSTSLSPAWLDRKPMADAFADAGGAALLRLPEPQLPPVEPTVATLS